MGTIRGSDPGPTPWIASARTSLAEATDASRLTRSAFVPQTPFVNTARRRGRRILAIALGLALAPCALELAYRTLRTSALSPTTNPSYVLHDEELGWRYRVGARARHRSEEFDVEIRINAQGFRGPDWPATRAGLRVLLLGDSLAFGWGVPWSETFGARLAAARPDWEVLNAAVSGYATDQELLLLRRLLPERQPDLVLCVFCGNDLWESRSQVVYGKSKPRFERQAGRLELTGVPVPRSWLERTSLLWCAWQKTRWERAFPTLPRDSEREWALIRDLFRAMRDELAGVPLLILSDTDELASLAREEKGLEHLDLREAFGVDARATTFPRDGHWNGLGHLRVADALAPRLAEPTR